MLTPEELESLRQEDRAAGEWMRAKLKEMGYYASAAPMPSGKPDNDQPTE